MKILSLNYPLNDEFFGQMLENIRNRLKIEFIWNCENGNFMKHQSKSKINGTHKSYSNFCSYILKHKEDVMDKPIFIGFAKLELSKLLMYESYYDKLPAYFGEKIIQCHYIETDAFLLNVISKDIIKDLKNPEDIFNFSNLYENHELFSNKTEKLL